MKPIKFFALVGIFTTIPIVLPAVAEVRQEAPFDESQNYVVIGAFAIHKNAIRFTSHASHLHLSAKFEMNPNRKLYYVYVLSTDDRERAINEAKKLRSETEFTDTWVYSGTMKNMGLAFHGVDINPDTRSRLERVSADDDVVSDKNSSSHSASSSLNSESAPSSSIVAGSLVSGSTSSPSSPAVSTLVSDQSLQTKTSDPVKDLALSTMSAETNTTGVSNPAKAEDTDEIAGKKFVFDIFRSVDSKKVEGDIDVIDNEKSRKVGTYKGNTEVRVSSPGNRTGNVSLVCEVFGYRKVQKDVNYVKPEGEGISEEGGDVHVPFELVRLQKGDIAVMYNVYFFKDAGVMRPESRYEVSSLLEMLKENPNYKIKIHGHTNGSSHGKIISMGDSKNFFSLTDTKEGFGSAKKLSEERARVIHEYLTSNGIDAKRTHVKAWGGKRPLQDKHSTRANENVRVEIEILED